MTDQSPLTSEQRVALLKAVHTRQHIAECRSALLAGQKHIVYYPTPEAPVRIYQLRTVQGLLEGRSLMTGQWLVIPQPLAQLEVF